MKKIIDIKETILDQISKKNRLQRTITTTIGCFIVALVYNCFIVPNDLVTGGVGGLAIIVSKLLGLNPVIFIDIVSIGLLFISFIILGKTKTFHSFFGFAMYAIMASLTEPLVKNFNLSFDSFLFETIIAAIMAGIGYGLIYKTGFNTGGMDSFIALLQKYINLPNTKISNVVNSIIIIGGMFLFGIPKTIYAIIYLKIINAIADIIILGKSNRKICFIKTSQQKSIENYIINELEISYTIIESDKNKIIMCVIPNDRFYTLQKDILTIDKTSTLITNDCYTVEGGSLNPLLDLTDL